MFGLIVSDPAKNETRRRILAERLHALDIPLTAFVEEPAPCFAADMSCAAFLRTASAALLMPGQPLPMDALLTHLFTADPLPGNVLRKYLFLQFSLLPYLRPGRAVTQLDGCFLVGEDLLIVPVTPEDTVDILLPPGVWTELTGAIHEGRLRCMRGYNEMPILVRENALLPIGVNDRTMDGDDADRLTLHWYQPKEKAACTLADGTRCEVERLEGGIAVHLHTVKDYHLILHENGMEFLIR